MPTGLSGLAVYSPNPEKLKVLRARIKEPYGFAAHMTGSSSVEQALKEGKDPLQWHVDFYNDPDSDSGTYIIGYDGKTVQIADEMKKCNHIGYKNGAIYRDESWKKAISPWLLQRWLAAWSGLSSPAQLFPLDEYQGPNNAYVGAEMLPIVKGTGAVPMAPGLNHTLAQHQAIVALSMDVAERWGWPAGWHRLPRLVGHEDVTPTSRSDKVGGWDPGWLRPSPRFDFGWVRDQIESSLASR